MFEKFIDEIRQVSVEGSPNLHGILKSMAYQFHTSGDRERYQCTSEEDDWRIVQDLLVYVLYWKDDRFFENLGGKSLEGYLEGEIREGAFELSEDLGRSDMLANWHDAVDNYAGLLLLSHDLYSEKHI